MYIRQFIIRVGHFIWTNMNSLHPRLQCARFGWNGPSGSAQEDYILSMYVPYFIIISPWKLAWHFTWTNLIPHHQSMRQIWPSGFWKKKFNFLNVFSLFCNYPTLYSLHPRMLCVKFGWHLASVSGEEYVNVKSLRQRRRRRTTDKLWSEKHTWAFGFTSFVSNFNRFRFYFKMLYNIYHL